MDATLLFSQILLLAAALHSGEARKCYVCSSLTEPKCADPMTDTTLETFECTSELASQLTNYLNKISKTFSDIGSSFGLKSNTPQLSSEFECSKLEFEAENKHVIQRACVPVVTKDFDTCKNLQSNNNKITFCETCNTDKCNSSSGIRAALALLIPAIALLLANS